MSARVAGAGGEQGTSRGDAQEHGPPATNPFEREGAAFLVLVNQEGQYSLWPEVIAVPGGWTAVKGPDTREACLAFIEGRWVDMRPASLIRALRDQTPPA